ncbi:FAD-binding protein [Halolactibacillus sp. JCM 19043]|uniref:FAD-binding protein n=1 Tax=Halolactibacillus sp. JCM 19043 TaxID=1460638 RepID=UPI000A6B4419|nr:FAD-binding protein [Halolactibacillus sp. JCM 19043]
MKRETVDVLVVGAGIAGVRATKTLLDNGHRVALVTKTQLASGSSFYPLKASLGTQVTNGKEDVAVFLKDIDVMSRGMHQEEIAKVYVNEIESAVNEYETIGIDATPLSGVRKACFAEHQRRIYLLKDWNKIRKNMREILEEYPWLTLHEKTTVFSLYKQDGRIVGAVMLDQNNDYIYVETKAVILATGGFGNIYKHNLNPVDVDGSGHILALGAGASLVNMEFIQFIPGMTQPKYKTLFGEHTLNYCLDVVDENNQSLFSESQLTEKEIKDILAIRSTHGPFTHTLDSRTFDILMMKSIVKHNNENGLRLLFDTALYENKTEFYTTYLDWLKERDIDLVKDPIKISPFAHASNGGVCIDVNGQTEVEGLYAIGELSANVEGANRLGGNSTGASMVFGKRAANHCHHYIGHTSQYSVTDQSVLEHIHDVLRNNVSNKSKRLLDDTKLNQIISEIKELLWYHANVVRNEQDLMAVLDRLHALTHQINPEVFLEHKQLRKLYLKANNYLQLGEVLIQAMLMRKESRGAHYREDYPHEDPMYAKPIVIHQRTGKLAFHFENNEVEGE